MKKSIEPSYLTKAFNAFVCAAIKEALLWEERVKYWKKQDAKSWREKWIGK